MRVEDREKVGRAPTAEKWVRCSRGPRAPRRDMGCCSRRGGARRLLVGELVGERVERRLERRNEILLVLDADRQPHKPVRDADLEPVFREHVCVRHHGGARADRLERAEVLAERPRPLDRIHERAARRGAALDLEPEHAAVQAVHVLPVGELFLREGGEPRVANHVHLWMPLEELGNRLRVLALLPHAQRERLGRLQRVEGVLRAHDVSVHVLHVLDALVQLGRGRDHRAANRHVVAIVVLCGGLDDKIDTVVDWPLKDGRREGRVASVKQAARLCERGDGGEVGEREGGVRRRLGKDQLCVWLEVGLNVCQLGEVDKVELHAHVGEEGPARAVGAAVRAVCDDAVVARLHR
mmetsp:Transcript_47824/g.154823  ORF Transcript_47824/g.154823 Transcript_47824/m.154823 type:complete len:352 (-) Transcript_47824:387-1442(-)